MSRAIAGCFALAAFAVAILAGLAAGNPAGEVLLRALIAMMLCYPVGLIVGIVCERIIVMHAQEQVESAVADAAAQTGERPKKPDTSEDEEEVITV